MGAPRPARREAALNGGCAAFARDADAVSSAPARPWSLWPDESGAPSPTGVGVVPGGAVDDSAHRLVPRPGPAPRGGGVWRLSRVVGWPVVDNGAAAGDPDGVADADEARAGPVDRWATATGSGLLVSGRVEGVIVAPGATVASWRIGAPAPTVVAVAAGTATSYAAPKSSPAAAGDAVRRCAPRVGMGVCDVRLGTVDTCATTRPGGAAAPVSCPNGCTIGGSGRWPGTSARNGVDGATSGAAETVRWMGGSLAQAPVAGAGAGAAALSETGPTGDAPSPASSCSREACPSDGVLRPNGQGRRTGLTPPRTGAC